MTGRVELAPFETQTGVNRTAEFGNNVERIRRN